MRSLVQIIRALVLSGSVSSALAQTVSIPDPGLNAAIHDALNKPSGPISEQDMLSLANLNARNRNIQNLQGLEFGRNLVSFHLEINRITNFSPLTALTNLVVLDLSVNPLTNFAVPG